MMTDFPLLSKKKKEKRKKKNGSLFPGIPLVNVLSHERKLCFVMECDTIGHKGNGN